MTSSAILIAIFFTATLAGFILTIREIRTMRKTSEELFGDLYLQIKEMQNKLLIHKEALSEIGRYSVLIKDNIHELQAHGKMTDVMLTKIKADSAKIISLIEK